VEKEAGIEEKSNQKDLNSFLIELSTGDKGQSMELG